MAAYRRVYDSCHLQADCQGPGSALEHYLYLYTNEQTHILDRLVCLDHQKSRQNDKIMTNLIRFAMIFSVNVSVTCYVNTVLQESVLTVRTKLFITYETKRHFVRPGKFFQAREMYGLSVTRQL